MAKRFKKKHRSKKKEVKENEIQKNNLTPKMNPVQKNDHIQEQKAVLSGRNKLNITLLAFYVVFIIAVPMITLIYGIDDVTVDINNSLFFKNVGQILLSVISAPVYGYYAYLMIKKHFPSNNMQAGLFFIPVLITSVFYLLSDRISLLEDLISGSLPMYLGLNMMFFIGLIILFVKNLIGASDIIARLIAIPILLFVLFFPVCYSMIVGYQLSVKYALTDFETFKELSEFFIPIILVIVFHYRTMINLFEEGAL